MQSLNMTLTNCPEKLCYIDLWSETTPTDWEKTGPSLKNLHQCYTQILLGRRPRYINSCQSSISFTPRENLIVGEKKLLRTRCAFWAIV